MDPMGSWENQYRQSCHKGQEECEIVFEVIQKDATLGRDCSFNLRENLSRMLDL